jgi:hypothetical protein
MKIEKTNEAEFNWYTNFEFELRYKLQISVTGELPFKPGQLIRARSYVVLETVDE